MSTEPAAAVPAEPHGIVECDEQVLHPRRPHSLTADCIDPRPAVWTPGAGVELMQREHPEWVPEVSAEDEAAADRLLASLPAEPRDRGICGEDAETLIASTLGGICTLLAGHSGWHASDDGMSWAYRTPPLRAWQPDDHIRVRAQALADPEVREAYIEAVKRAAFERGKAEAQRDVHADVIVPCRDTREDLDGALCTGEFRYGPHDIQAKCTVCGGWRGRWAPAERSAYEEGIFDTGIAEGRRQAEAEYAHRHRIRQPHECPRCGSGDRPLHEKWGLCGYCVAEVGWDA